MGTSVHGIVFGNLSQSEHENLHAHRVNSATKSTESCDLPGKTASTLAMKSKVETLCRGVANHSRVAECTRLSPDGEFSGVS
jgi:hypothetical protein